MAVPFQQLKAFFEAVELDFLNFIQKQIEESENAGDLLIRVHETVLEKLFMGYAEKHQLGDLKQTLHEAELSKDELDQIADLVHSLERRGQELCQQRYPEHAGLFS